MLVLEERKVKEFVAPEVITGRKCCMNCRNFVTRGLNKNNIFLASVPIRKYFRDHKEVYPVWCRKQRVPKRYVTWTDAHSRKRDCKNFESMDQ